MITAPEIAKLHFQHFIHSSPCLLHLIPSDHVSYFLIKSYNIIMELYKVMSLLSSNYYYWMEE